MSAYPWTWAFLCLALFWLAACSFLPQQSIWTDEATQMSGLKLGPVQVVQWLLGRDFQLGVPFDRMPPLSYWMGQGWASLFGLSDFSMRLMGLFFSSLALLVTFHTAYRGFGMASAVVAGLLFATSPNLIISAVEIRAYPLFLFWSSLGLYFFSQLLKSDSRQASIGLAASCLAAIYTHYYGILLTIVLLSVLAIKQRSVLRMAFAIGLLSLGVLPFIMEAFQQSSSDLGTGKRAGEELLRLAYRLLFHVSILNPILLYLGILGALGLAFLAIRERQGLPFLYVAGMGFAIVALAEFLTKTFQAASPSYNIWMIPALILFLSSALTRKFASLFALCLILSTASGAYQLAVNGTAYSHGPYNQLKTLIEKHLPGVSLVYEGDPAPAAMASIAVNYLFHGSVSQYQGAVDPSHIPQPVLMVIEAQNQSAVQLQKQLKSGEVKPLEPGPVVRQLLTSSEWRLSERKTLLALVKLEVFVFEKK